MKYISKGIVAEGSTEHILKIQRGGYEFQLTGDRARLWLNGRFGVADADGTNPRYVKELLHLIQHSNHQALQIFPQVLQLSFHLPQKNQVLHI